MTSPEAKSTGVECHLTKPVSIDELTYLSTNIAAGNVYRERCYLLPIETKKIGIQGAG